MNDYVAHVESVASIIRIFDVDKDFGDEYLWCCTLRWINPTKVELCGVVDFPNMSYRHAMGKTLWKMGVKEVIFNRKKDNKERTITIDVESMAKREKWPDD